MAESPGSSLTSIVSGDISDHDGSKPDLIHGDLPRSPSALSSTMPPSKRRRTGGCGHLIVIDQNSTLSHSHIEDHPPVSPSSSISSDTSGDVPNSPSAQALLGGQQDDDYSGHGGDQVTACQWRSCQAGDLGNMDDLVRHIHEIHITNREKRFICEWTGCPRNGQPHASGYALRAHMRSHTREKPFYCSLPECDRSFTRSDALAKHMRTVHETEALRPSDPVPKHQQAAAGASGPGGPVNKVQRIKLKLSQPKDEGQLHHLGGNRHHTAQSMPITLDDPTISVDDINDIDLPEFSGQDTNIGFDEHELALRPRDLYRLLRRQIHWAEAEGRQLHAEWEEILPKRKQAWTEKEAVLDDLIHTELRLLSSVMTSEPPAAIDATYTFEELHQEP